MTNPLALIIEDDEKLSTIFVQALKLAEFETEVVQDGNKALKRLIEIIPALVILDLHLPGVSGKDILRQIRGDNRLKETKIILASADATMAQDLEKEADLVLIKPISFIQLRDLASRFRPFDPLD